MIFKNYSHLKNTHAFLSPSKYSWIRYPKDKLVESYSSFKRISLGTEYHEAAKDLIRLAIRLPKTKAAFNRFVNDGIGFKMEPEVLLYYSPYCYGQADCISFHDRILRIHDLKTGTNPGSMDQLMIYAGLFCLDYKIDIMSDIDETILRIYHDIDVLEYTPSKEDLLSIVSIIKEAVATIQYLEESTS